MSEASDDKLEHRMRQALHPVSPDADFVARVMQSVTAEPAPRKRNQRVLWLGAAAAASIALLVGVRAYVHEQREREAAMQVKQQVIDALNLTSEKLNLAYRAIQVQGQDSNSSSPQPHEDNSGA